MKRLNIYEIREMAKKTNKAVYSIQQLANLISKPKKIANVYAMRLVQKGLAKRMLRGKISFSEDEHVIATQLVEPSYISLYSALLFHQLTDQVPANIQCVTPVNSRNYDKLGIIYHRIPPALFYGYKKYKKDFSYVFVADPEKAIVDAVYLNMISKETIKEITNIDREKLRQYIEQFKGRGRKKLVRWLL